MKIDYCSSVKNLTRFEQVLLSHELVGSDKFQLRKAITYEPL